MLTSLRQLARTLFSDQIRLRRSGWRLSLAVVPADAIEFTASQMRRQEALREQQALAVLMLEELDGVVATCSEPRHRMPHLLQFRQGLQTHGLIVLKALPLPVLVRALAEFEEAVTNWAPVGLATLRSKMAVAVADRRKAGEADRTPAVDRKISYSDVPRTGSGPEVREVDIAVGADAADAQALLRAYGATPPDTQASRTTVDA